MKSIKDLINATGLIPVLKKEVKPVIKINWDDVELGVDANGLRQLNKLNKWLQTPVADRNASCKILFYGKSSINKTRAIKTIAGQSGLNVYRIKLSEVISKYPGETEKNLDKIFDAIASENRVLFFDEGDALFAKRTNVEDAHDRYANTEIAYLLQRLEESKGIAILYCKECDGSDKLLAKHFNGVVHFPSLTKNNEPAVKNK